MYIYAPNLANKLDFAFSARLLDNDDNSGPLLLLWKGTFGLLG